MNELDNIRRQICFEIIKMGEKYGLLSNKFESGHRVYISLCELSGIEAVHISVSFPGRRHELIKRHSEKSQMIPPNEYISGVETAEPEEKKKPEKSCGGCSGKK